jgi:hypothetical protein
MVVQPPLQSRRVLDGALPEAEVLADLRAVVAPRAIRPLALVEAAGRDVDLAGDEHNRLLRQPLRSARERPWRV